jgi:midasin (ATPase involved in ribosome maturation)
LEEKKKIIINAFENGDALWIDEINSCIDDGLEKTLNLALTGFHPENNEASKKPGFLVLATANGIDLEGRSKMSPALLSRFNHVKAPTLKQYSIEDIKKIFITRITASNNSQEEAEQLSQILGECFLEALKMEDLSVGEINLRFIDEMIEIANDNTKLSGNIDNPKYEKLKLNNQKTK